MWSPTATAQDFPRGTTRSGRLFRRDDDCHWRASEKEARQQVADYAEVKLEVLTPAEPPSAAYTITVSYDPVDPSVEHAKTRDEPRDLVSWRPAPRVDVTPKWRARRRGKRLRNQHRSCRPRIKLASASPMHLYLSFRVTLEVGRGDFCDLPRVQQHT